MELHVHAQPHVRFSGTSLCMRSMFTRIHLEAYPKFVFVFRWYMLFMALHSCLQNIEQHLFKRNMVNVTAVSGYAGSACTGNDGHVSDWG